MALTLSIAFRFGVNEFEPPTVLANRDHLFEDSIRKFHNQYNYRPVYLALTGDNNKLESASSEHCVPLSLRMTDPHYSAKAINLI